MFELFSGFFLTSYHPKKPTHSHTYVIHNLSGQLQNPCLESNNVILCLSDKIIEIGEDPIVIVLKVSSRGSY